MPLILVSSGTRAELEPLRRKMENGHPSSPRAEAGSLSRTAISRSTSKAPSAQGRYFCVAFGRPYADAVAAAEELAEESGASIVGYSQMTAREISRNTGESVAPGGTGPAARIQRALLLRGRLGGSREPSLSAKLTQLGWDAIRGEPFWELRSGNDEGRALRHLMRLLRDSLHTRLRAVAIGSSARDLSLLSAADHALVLPRRGAEFDPCFVPGCRKGFRARRRGQRVGIKPC